MSRNAVLHSFYCSLDWCRFRRMLIAERGPVCECGCGKSIPTPRDVMLHHTPIELTIDNVFDKNISLNPLNVKIFSRACHDRAHKRFSKFGDKRVYLIYGMPCSGKTTYVLENKQRNDIVIDMDRLYEAVTLLPAYDKPDQLLGTVRMVYNNLLDQVKTRYGKWNTAWVVGGFPERQLRERTADELGAELIWCECTKDEALSRLDSDPVRSLIRSVYVSYIDKWLDKYS